MKTFKDFIQELTGYVRRIQMQPGIRDAVRERLSAYADLHAFEGAAPAPSRVNIFDSLNLRFFQAGFALLLVAVSMGGVAYASNDALPGDRLYAVKTKVVEPVESALLRDPRSQATWNAILAERRLAEAAALAAEGTLDEATRAELESSFAVHADRSRSKAEEVRAKGDVAVALAMHSDLEARLSAHADLFSYIADEKRPEARKLLARIAEKRDSIAAERQAAEAEVAMRTLAYGTSDIDAAVEATDKVAKSASVEGAASGSIDARINAAREALSSARASSERGEGGIAYVAAQAAARLTHEAAILAKNRGILALAPIPSAAGSAPASPERAPGPAKAKEGRPQNAKMPGGSVMLMTAPATDADETATKSPATSTDEKKEEKEKGKEDKTSAREDDEDDSRTEKPSQDSQDDEDSSNENTSTRGSSVQNVIRSVLSPLGL